MMEDSIAVSDVILETDSLTKRFGGVTAIESVSLKIQRGE